MVGSLSSLWLVDKVAVIIAPPDPEFTMRRPWFLGRVQGIQPKVTPSIVDHQSALISGYWWLKVLDKAFVVEVIFGGWLNPGDKDQFDFFPSSEAHAELSRPRIRWFFNQDGFIMFQCLLRKDPVSPLFNSSSMCPSFFGITLMWLWFKMLYP